MTVLRELIARLGFQVDGTGFRQAESAVSRVRSGLQELAAVAATIGIGAAAKQVIELASDAQETRNVLQQAFGAEGATVVQQWAERVGDEIGRSHYEIEGFTAGLGAMLGPMVGSQATAQEMSQAFAQLAVDLGSFFNTSDSDALTALRAGLAGESEPLRKYGVVLLDATLQEFAHAQGIHKKITAMNVAEKTQLRYQFILAKTTTAQGDAARTSDSYANSVKALRGALKDMGTEIGGTILPKIEKVIRSARDGLHGFKEWANSTKILETSMASVAAVAVTAGGAMLVPWLPLLLTFGAIVVVLEDLNVLFSGGRSLIGQYIDEMFGIGTAAALVETWHAGLEELPRVWNDIKDAVEDFSASDAWASLGESVDLVLQDIEDSFAHMFEWLLAESIKAWDELRGVFGFGPSGITPPKIDTGGDKLRSDIEAKRKERADARASKRADREANRIAEREARKLGLAPKTAATTGTGELVAAGRGVDAPAKEVEFGRAGMREPRPKLDLYGIPKAVVSAPAAAPKAPNAPASVSVGGTVINVQGWDERKILRVIEDAMSRERRKTAAALAGAGG